jgi:hypothetical protein
VTISAKVTGGDGKAIKQMLASHGARLKAANKKSADEFMALVKLAVPQGQASKHGHLVDTVQESDVNEVGVQVSIGDAERPYPAHLELGHRSRGGTHVPGKMFWYPAKRVVQKRSHNRILRAERVAIKSAAAATAAE